MFSLRLKELREKAGYSQYSFADKFGVAQSTVGGWESGKREPNFETISRLADFFHVSVDFLIGRDTQTEKPTTQEDDELSKLLEDPETREFYELIKDFSDDELEDLLNYGQYLISKRDPKKKP